MSQVWDVEEAVEYVKQLSEFKPWFIEEPTAPVSVTRATGISHRLTSLCSTIAG